ncbi:MAG: hypothetical protein ACP5HX_10595 [Thermoproteota archaeon]
MRRILPVVVLAMLTVATLLSPFIEAQVPVAVWGYVYMPDGSPASGASVTVSGGGDSVSTTAGSDGKYGPVTLTVSSTPVTITVKASKGEYSGSASASGEGTIRIDVRLSKPAPPPPPPPPPPPTSSVSISVSMSSVRPGESVTISGSVSPSREIAVTIEFSTDKVSWEKLAEVKSSSSGVYSYVWYPYGSEITYYLRASIPSQGELPSATSGIVSVQVTSLPGAAVSIASNVTLPIGKTTYIRVSSTSSSCNVNVDLKDKKVLISVSGPKNTTGTTVLFISDELLASYRTTIEKVVFMIDNREISPLITRVIGGYTVTFTYTHSTHTIEVYYVTYELSISVLDYSGKPVPGVTLNLTGPVSRISKTNSTGVAVFIKLIPGNYSIVALSPEVAGKATLTVTKSQTLTLSTEIGLLKSQYEELQKKCNELKETNEKLKENNENLYASFQDLNAKYNSLNSSYASLKASFDKLQNDYNSLRTISMAYGVLSIIIIAALLALFYRVKKPTQRKQEGKA